MNFDVNKEQLSERSPMESQLVNRPTEGVGINIERQLSGGSSIPRVDSFRLYMLVGESGKYAIINPAYTGEEDSIRRILGVGDSRSEGKNIKCQL